MSPALNEALSLLTNAGNSLIGEKLKAKDDWSYNGLERYDFEILIGNTTRPESKELFDSLSYYDYAYKVISENCVVICGGSDEATLKAVHRFLVDSYGHIADNGGELRDVKVGTVYRYNHDYPERSILLCGDDIEDYTIVYSGSYADEYSANVLRSEISRLSNVRLPIKSIDEFEGGDAIYIGIDENGGHLYDDFGEGGYVVKYASSEYKTVVIDSNKGIRDGTLVNAFCEEYLHGIPDEGTYYIDMLEGERFHVADLKQFNGLRLQSTETAEIGYGVIYQKLTYKDSNGAPVIAYAVIADTEKVTAINATPNYSDETVNAKATTLAAMKSAEGVGYTVIAGVNGDFFAIDSDYHPRGLCVKQGKVLNLPNSHPWFAVTNEGRPVIGTNDQYFNVYQNEIVEAVGGTHILLRDGFYNDLGIGDPFGYIRHPRTAVGITEDDKIVLLVVDGRQPELSNGASLSDLAYIMANLGVKDALNLDGGGSSAFVTHTEGEDYVVQNSPSDGWLRRVYNSIVLVKRDK